MDRKSQSLIPRLSAEIRASIVAASSRTVPTLRKLRREITRQIKPSTPNEVFDLALGLLAIPGFPKWFAYELIHHHRDAMAKLTLPLLLKLGRGLSAWYEVDPFACYLSGPAWREGRISDKDVHRWAAASDHWWRRVAVVSTVPLNNTARGGHGDAERTLAVCDLVKTDRDDMIVKALSWALRELARKDPQAVQKYARANKKLLAARVLREVNNKLKTGLKNPKTNVRGSS